MPKGFVQVALAVAALCCALGVAACGGSSESSETTAAAGSESPTKLRYQLSWMPSAQFAGLYVAQEKGFFEKHNLEVELVPGGPSVNPINAIANGSVDLGDSQPSSVVLARSQGLPLTQVYQLQQESATVYVAKKSSDIETLEDVKGKRVGLYFGGYQAEFLSMLDHAGIDPKEVNMFPQPPTMVPFLEGKYDVAMTILWNEFLTILDDVPTEELTILKPSDYGGGLVGTSIATTEKFADEKASELQRFLDAAAEGWVWALENPDEAAKIVTDRADGLVLDFQKRTMRQRINVICTGPTMDAQKGLGYITPSLFEDGQRILLDTKQVKKPLPIEDMFQTRFWDAIPKEFKHPNCAEGAVN